MLILGGGRFVVVAVVEISIWRGGLWVKVVVVVGCVGM